MTFRAQYEAGRRQGEAGWFADGNLLRRGFFVDDLLEGDLVDFFPGGEVREKVPHVEGQPHGTMVRYTKSGKVKEKLYFYRGQQVSRPPQSEKDHRARKR